MAWFVRDIWHKYHSLYFKIVSNFTHLTAREITYNNFVISLVVFMPNITPNLDYEQSLFSVVRRAKRETRKWPRAWLMARDGRGTKNDALVSRVSRLRRFRARALLSLNLKKNRDCSQSTPNHAITYTNNNKINYLSLKIFIQFGLAQPLILLNKLNVDQIW